MRIHAGDPLLLQALQILGAPLPPAGGRAEVLDFACGIDRRRGT
jgi:hypothetical protein